MRGAVRCGAILALLLGMTVAARPQALLNGWLAFNIIKGTTIYTNVVRFDGSEQRTIVEADGLLDPSLSSDGRTIIGSRIGPQSTIVSLRLDGSHVRSICTIGGYAFAPTWSPDMRSIAFCLVQSSRPRVYAMTAAGANVRPVSEAGTMAPRWSSDGQRLAYVTFDLEGKKGAIGITDLASGTRRTLLERDAPITDVAWAPGDRRLAFAQAGPDGTQVVLVNADGSNPTPLTHTVGARSGLRFSADGATLYYSRAQKRGQSSTLVALPIGGEERDILKAAPGESIMISGGLLMFWAELRKP